MDLYGLVWLMVRDDQEENSTEFSGRDCVAVLQKMSES